MPVREVQHRKDSRLFAQLCSTLLRKGHSVQFSVHGESMRPNILDGDSVLVAPTATRDLRQGDIALVENPDGLRLHRVVSFPSSGTVITAAIPPSIRTRPLLTFSGKWLFCSKALASNLSLRPGLASFIPCAPCFIACAPRQSCDFAAPPFFSLDFSPSLFCAPHS